MGHTVLKFFYMLGICKLEVMGTITWFPLKCRAFSAILVFTLWQNVCNVSVLFYVDGGTYDLQRLW